MINISSILYLEILSWQQTIRSPDKLLEHEPFKAPPQETWNITSRFQNREQIEFSNGRAADDIEISLGILSATENADWVEKYKLQNTAGALFFHDDERGSFIGGTLVLDDKSFQLTTSAVKSFNYSSSLRLSVTGLQPANTSQSINSWDTVNNKKLIVEHIELNFLYEKI